MSNPCRVSLPVHICFIQGSICLSSLCSCPSSSTVSCIRPQVRACLVAVASRRGVRRSRAGLGIRYLSVVLVLVVVRCRLGSHRRSLSVIALTQLIRLNVRGQCIRVVLRFGSALLAEETEQAPALSVARSIVVSWTRAEALFLASVADEDDFEKRREDEEYAN